MSKKVRFPKIFFGWWTTLSGGLMDMWSAGYTVYGISALFKPICAELGFSRAEISLVSSIGSLEGAFEGPLAGWISDKYGPKWIMLFGVFCITTGFILMNFVHPLWSFLLVWGVIVGTGKSFATGTPLSTAIANWFVKKRGLALSVKGVITGLSGVLILPLVSWMIITQGWRMTCVIGGVVMGLFGILFTWFFVKQHRPEYYGLLPDGAKVEENAVDTSQVIARGVGYAAEVEETEFTLRQVMKTRVFWLLIILPMVPALVSPAMSMHLIPFLTDRGIDPLKAAGMMAIMVGTSLPCRFVGGFIADRLKVRYLPLLIAGGYLFQAAGIAFFLLHQTINMIYVWFILYGIGMGVHNVPPTVLRARYFGRKAFGSIIGISSLLSTPLGIVAPVYVGWVYDTTGSYMSSFTLLAGLLALTGVLYPLVIRNPKPPTQVTDIHKFL